MKNIVVLHILSSRAYNGAENVVFQIKSMFEDSNIKIIYCSLDGPIRKQLEEEKFEFYPIKEMSIKEIKQVIHKVKPDIIHAHDMRASFFSALACGKIPLISHVHNNNFDSRTISLKSILYYYAAKKARHIFWVSQASFNGYAFHERLKQKSMILYNVIDANKIYQKAAQDPEEYDYDIVYVGRLTYPKNPQRLVKVIAGIAKKYPKLKAAIVGTGDMEAEIKQLVKDMGAETFIDMLGYRINPYKIIRQSKLMIMTSLYEGLPMCALEAMALGVPIVSTPVDGLKEIVDNGENGYLSDNDDLLIEKCYDIITNSELRESLSNATLKKASIFMNTQLYRKKIENAYTRVVKYIY